MATKGKGSSKKPASRRASRKRARRSGWRRMVLVIAGGLLGLMLVLFGSLYAFAEIPDPNDIAAAQSVTVLDREGKQIGRISAEADRVSIPLRDMPQHLRDAVIATEDRRFYKHQGVSLIAIARATLANLVGRRVVQGGSTITQQYVKNAFVGNERSLFRKTKEALISLKLERKYSKDEILELYLNTIYFGRGAYGVEAASQAYFGKKAKSLTLDEAALLAGVIQAPESYDPSKDEDAATGRRNAVLKFMVRDGHISVADAEEAADRKIKIRRRRAGGRAPHFLEDVRRFLEQEIGPRRLYDGGITVSSTLDLKMQDAAEEAVEQVYDRKSDPEAALIAIDPKAGEVRAMVGARDFGRRQLNLATRARRQPGSTFKPAVLAAAVEEGLSVRKRYDAPGDITIDTDSGPWEVSNYDDRGHGSLPLTRATELSVNTVYAQLIMDVGPDIVARVANRSGVASDLQPVPSLALGTSDVTVLDMASMYATFAARGEYRTPVLVTKVSDRDGKVLYEPEQEQTRALETNDADTVNKVLQGVIEDGTGRSADIDRPAAAKTGTTQDFRDAWFAGYTPDLVAVVWNGYPGKNKVLRDVRGINVVGGSFPAQMWRHFMTEALEGVPPSKFPEPKIEGDEKPETRDTPTPSATASRTPPADVPAETRVPAPQETKAPGKSKKEPEPSESATPDDSPSPSPSPS